VRAGCRRWLACKRTCVLAALTPPRATGGESRAGQEERHHPRGGCVAAKPLAQG
jgi:hypothetical protein